MNLNELYLTLLVPNPGPSPWLRALQPFINEGESLPALSTHSDRWIALTKKVQLYRPLFHQDAYLTHEDDTEFKQYFTLEELLKAHPTEGL